MSQASQPAPFLDLVKVVAADELADAETLLEPVITSRRPVLVNTESMTVLFGLAPGRAVDTAEVAKLLGPVFRGVTLRDAFLCDSATGCGVRGGGLYMELNGLVQEPPGTRVEVAWTVLCTSGPPENLGQSITRAWYELQRGRWVLVGKRNVMRT